MNLVEEMKKTVQVEHRCMPRLKLSALPVQRDGSGGDGVVLNNEE